MSGKQLAQTGAVDVVAAVTMNWPEEQPGGLRLEMQEALAAITKPGRQMEQECAPVGEQIAQRESEPATTVKTHKIGR